MTLSRRALFKAGGAAAAGLALARFMPASTALPALAASGDGQVLRWSGTQLEFVDLADNDAIVHQLPTCNVRVYPASESAHQS